MNQRPALLALVGLAVLGLAVPAAAQTRPITLAWDSSPEPSVAGYIVYVGSVSGSYDERYDVGNQQSFVYDRILDGRPYYFAVAAYAAGPHIGPPSEEIFFLSGSSSTPPRSIVQSLATTSSVASPAYAGSGDGRTLCSASGTAGCYRIDQTIGVDGLVSALVPTEDGRLFFIQDRNRVRVIDDGSLISAPAFFAGAGSEITTLVLDPDFAHNRFVYVVEAVTRADGGREANIVRYRELANVMAEAAVVVAGLPLPASGDAPLAIDDAGRLYIAVPAAARSGVTASPYDGMVLRFERDGRLPDDNRAPSPIFAEGVEQPAALVWADGDNVLWLAGRDAGGRLGQLPLGDTTSGWPHAFAPANVPHGEAVAGLSNASGRLLLADESGHLFQFERDRSGVARPAPIDVDQLGGTFLSGAFGPDRTDNVLFIAIGSLESSPATSQIFRLQR